MRLFDKIIVQLGFPEKISPAFRYFEPVVWDFTF